MNDIQFEHYIDNGCFCKLCSKKRDEYFVKLICGEKITEKINHDQLVLLHQEKKIKEVTNKIKTLSNYKQINNKFTKGTFKMNIL
jgi:hypothetical protein